MCNKCGNNACGGCQPKIPQGLPGTNGKNAFGITVASFTMPSVPPGSPSGSEYVLIVVSSTGQFTNQWAIPGQFVYVEGAGHFQVVSISGNNGITIRNLGYTGNATPGVTIPSGAKVSPAGERGADGVSPSYFSFFETIYSDTSVSNTENLSATIIKDCIIQPNSLQLDGDALEIMFQVSQSNTPFMITFDYIRLAFGSTQMFPTLGILPANSFILPNKGTAQFNVKFVRTGTSTAKVYYEVSGSCIGISESAGMPIANSYDVSGIDFTVSNLLQLSTTQTVANAISCAGLFVNKTFYYG